jgi:hypothetical protein
VIFVVTCLKKQSTLPSPVFLNLFQFEARIKSFESTSSQDKFLVENIESILKNPKEILKVSDCFESQRLRNTGSNLKLGNSSTTKHSRK